MADNFLDQPPWNHEVGVEEDEMSETKSVQSVDEVQSSCTSIKDEQL